MHTVDVDLLHSLNWDATLISFLAGTQPPTPGVKAGFLLEGPTVGGERAVAAAVCLHYVLISVNSDLTGSV